MSCYLGETETTPDTVAFTASIETPWDDGTGTSALLELCRMVNNRLAALHQSTFTFSNVGSSAPDGSFVGRNYGSNPTRHPIREFVQVLDQCRSEVLAMVTPQTLVPIAFGGMINGSGYQWRYNNAATVKATLVAAINGLNSQLLEDWELMILALRAALDSLSGAQIQSAPWTAATITIRFPTGSDADDEGIPSNKVTSRGELNLASVTPSIGGSSTDWVIDTSAGANLYGDRAARTSTHTSLFADTGRDLGVAFAGDENDPAPATVEYHGTSKLFEAAIPVRGIGWDHGLSVRRTYTMTCVGTSGINLTALNGKSIPWHAEARKPSSFDLTDLPVTFSAGSGSVVWSGNTAGASATKTVIIDADLDLPAIANTEDARDWWNLMESANVFIVLDTYIFNFCIDANGTAHDD